jgi:hypothetical protein
MTHGISGIAITDCDPSSRKKDNSSKPGTIKPLANASTRSKQQAKAVRKESGLGDAG